MTDGVSGVSGVEKLSLLFELSRAFTAQIELQELLPLIMAQTQVALGAENCSLLLLDEAKHELFFPVTSDVSPDVGAQLQEIRFPSHRGIAGWVLQHGEAALVPDVTQDVRFYPDVDKQSGARTRDLLYAPLRTRSGSIGVIGLRNKRTGAFTQEDLAFLNALAGTVAIAIENARLYQQVKQSESHLKEEVVILISVQDSLLARVRTGTYSRRLRLVLDLSTKATPKFSVQQQQYLVTVALTASGGESSAPFSYVLFTLPGRTVSTQSQPPVAAPSPTTPSVQEAKTRVPVEPLAPPQTVEPAKTRESEIPPADQVKKSEKLGTGGKKVVPEQVKAQEKPSPLLQPSPVSKPTAEKKPSGPEEQRAVSPAPAEPTPVAKKSEPREPEPGKPEPGEPEPGEPVSAEPEPSKPVPREQKTPAVAEEGQAPAQDNQAASPMEEGQDSFERGQAFHAKGKVDAAIAQWQDTFRVTPKNAKAHHLLGVALQHRRKTAEAIPALQEAVRLTPGDAVAHIHLGQALEAKGDLEAARAAYQKAQQLVPTSAYVYDRLGHLSAAREKWGETVYAWGETVRLRPQSASAHANLGEALTKAGKQEEALAEYEQALRLDPRMALADQIRQRMTQLRTAAP